MVFRVLFVLAVLVSSGLLIALLSTSDSSTRVPADRHEIARGSAQPEGAERRSMFCESRLWEAPFNGAEPEDVALEFIRLERFQAQVLEPNGCWRLVNFWATWCEPCRKEMPELVGLADRFRDRNFELVTVNLEPPQTGEAALQFLREYNANLVNYRLDIPDTDTIAELLEGRWMGAIPFTMIINPVGDIVFWEHGLFDVDDVARQLEQRLSP